MRVSLIVLIASLLISGSVAQLPLIHVGFDEPFWNSFTANPSTGRANVTGNQQVLQFYNGSGGPNYGLSFVPAARTGIEVAPLSLDADNGSSLFIDGLTCGPFQISVPASFRSISFRYRCVDPSRPNITVVFDDTPLYSTQAPRLRTASYPTLPCGGLFQTWTLPAVTSRMISFSINEQYTFGPQFDCLPGYRTWIQVDNIDLTNTPNTNSPTSGTETSTSTTDGGQESDDDGLWWKILISVLISFFGGLLIGLAVWYFYRAYINRKYRLVNKDDEEAQKKAALAAAAAAAQTPTPTPKPVAQPAAEDSDDEAEKKRRTKRSTIKKANSAVVPTTSAASSSHKRRTVAVTTARKPAPAALAEDDSEEEPAPRKARTMPISTTTAAAAASKPPASPTRAAVTKPVVKAAPPPPPRDETEDDDDDDDEEDEDEDDVEDDEDSDDTPPQPPRRKAATVNVDKVVPKPAAASKPAVTSMPQVAPGQRRAVTMQPTRPTGTAPVTSPRRKPEVKDYDDDE